VKIAHLLYESVGDPFGIGGTGVRAYEIYRRLKARHDVTLVCKRYPGARDGDIDGLRHVYVGAESRSLTRTLLAYGLQGARFIRAHGAAFDVVVEEFAPPIPTFLHAFTDRPVVLQVQGHTGRHYFRKYNPAYAAVLVGLEKLRPRFYRTVIVPSRHTAARASLARTARVDVVPNGVPPELLERVPSEGDYVLYLGRIDPYSKGLDTLLEAYPAFHAACPGVRLVIAGAGKEAARFEAMLARLPAATRATVQTPGWVAGERKLELLSQARFVVVPSRHEAQPIGALEAMACGKAMLVSDLPELGDVVERDGGVAFRTGDAASLARAMATLAASDALGAMGQRARDWVKACTWDNIAVRFEAVLHAVLERGGHD
jgi:glycosyltransferase involved in cell wall biosynthesis